MATETIKNLLSDIANQRFAYKSSVSLDALTTSGLFYCDYCTSTPTNAPWTSYAVEVIGVTGAIKQVIRPIGVEGYCFERHYTSGSWSGWREIGRAIQINGDTSTFVYTRKTGDMNYGSFIITGTAAGLGAVLIGVTINNHAIASIRNLMTGASWSDSNLTITYGIENNIGWIGIKTTSSAGSNLCIIGG